MGKLLALAHARNAPSASPRGRVLDARLDTDRMFSVLVSLRFADHRPCFRSMLQVAVASSLAVPQHWDVLLHFILPRLQVEQAQSLANVGVYPAYVRAAGESSQAALCLRVWRRCWTVEYRIRVLGLE